MPYYYGPEMFDPFTFLWHALVVLLVVLFVLRIFCGPRWRRWGRMSGREWWSAHSALEILNERYAKGEVGKEEYEERKKTLMGN